MTRRAMHGVGGAGVELGQDQEGGGDDEQAAGGGRPAAHRASRVDGLENTGHWHYTSESERPHTLTARVSSYCY
jgi:hypothetical protein